MKQGLIHLYYGDGKGKTTAAMGLCLRAAGHGKHVVVLQFLKDGTSSELNVLRALPKVTVMTGETAQFTFAMTEEEQAQTQTHTMELFRRAMDFVSQGGIDVLLLDEVCLAVQSGFLDGKLLEQFLDGKPGGLEVVLTGRTPSDFMRRRADYVTEMRCHKHPFDRGISARAGIEF